MEKEFGMGRILENQKKKRVKRGGKKFKKHQNENLSVYSINAAGLKGKIQRSS